MTESQATPESKPATTTTKTHWGLLLVVALTVLVADQVTKFLAVARLTTAFGDAHAEGLGQQLSAWVRLKDLMNQSLGPHQLAPVVKGFWSLRYAENHGAAWSIAANWPEAIRVPFFHIVSIVAIGLIGFYYRKLRPDQRLLRLALSLVMGGAAGNLVDRIIRGYVIDFMDWHVNDHFWANPRLHWPTFNVADMGISCGVALIALDTLLAWWASRKAPTGTPANAAE